MNTRATTEADPVRRDSSTPPLARNAPLENVARLAQELLEVETAGVLFEDTDGERGWVTSGAMPEGVTMEHALLTEALTRKEAWILEDLQREPELAMGPQATPWQFFGSFPLSDVAPGQTGALFVADTHVHTMEGDAWRAIDALASLACSLVPPKARVKEQEDLTELLAQVSGQEFFAWLARHLSQRLQVRMVLVVELSRNDPSRLETIIAYDGGEIVPNFSYEIDGTPCAEVLGKRMLVFPRDVAQQFPEDKLLVDFGIESYAGAPLFNSSRVPIGVLCVLDSQPFDQPERIREALSSFAPRVSGEIEHKRTVDDIRALVEGSSHPKSTIALERLVQSVTSAFPVKVAMIAEPVAGREGYCRTVAACVDGKLEENFEFELEHVPCGGVYERDFVFEPSQLRVHFPGVPFLESIQAESYMGMGLKDSGGRMIGHVCIVHDEPIIDGSQFRHLFEVFVARAGAELERRKVEEQRVAVERASLESQKLESLGLLAGGVAHEFNNILAGILGNVSLSLEELPLNSPFRRQVLEIEEYTQRASDLAHQMLAFSGRGRFVLEEVDLGELIASTAHLIEISLPTGVNLELNLGQQLPFVSIDAAQVRQLIMHLVRNASDAMEKQPGNVRLSTGLQSLDREALALASIGSELEPGPYVYLEIADSGCGMDEITRARMLEPFFSSKAVGRGLGLAAVQGIVRGHEAALVLETEVGVGSRFRVLFPAPARGAAGDSLGKGDQRGKRLALVVDDELAVRTVVHRMLDRLGIETLLAADGKEALELFHQHSDAISVVFLDLIMPHMNGQDALDEFRRQRPELKVVLMSGYSECDVLESFPGQELTGFLQKPFSFRDVSDLLHQIAL